MGLGIQVERSLVGVSSSWESAEGMESPSKK